MNIINQFSYPLIAASILIIVYIILRYLFRIRWAFVIPTEAFLFISFIIGLIILRPSGNVNSVEQAIQTVGNSRPTLIAFFSNYCSGCLALNPIVDALEADIQDDFNVLRINIHTDVGRALREEFGFSFTPEFVLFSPDGREIWRDHLPPTQSDLDKALLSSRPEPTP